MYLVSYSMMRSGRPASEVGNSFGALLAEWLADFQAIPVPYVPSQVCLTAALDNGRLETVLQIFESRLQCDAITISSRLASVP